MTITVSLLYILLLQNYLVQVNGHGRLVEPPSRASAWRYISFTFSIKSLNQLEHEYHTPSEHISLIAADIGISKFLVYFRLFFFGRYGFNTPENYNDHELYSGGWTKQHQTNNGKCGVCGDPFDLPQVCACLFVHMNSVT